MSPDASTEGPPLATLVQRLALTPPDFFTDGVDVPALLADVVLALCGAPVPRDGQRFLDTTYGPGTPAPSRQGAGIVCWLALTPELGTREKQALATSFWAVLDDLSRNLARARDPRTWVHDGEGREETARAFLRALGLRPAGETPEQAADRWQTVSSAHRRLVAAGMSEQAARAEELARALAEKRAKDAAAQYNNY